MDRTDDDFDRTDDDFDRTDDDFDRTDDDFDRTDDDFEFQVESRLTSHGVYVDEFTVEDDAYEVVYESMAATDGEIPNREVGRVINVIRDLHPPDWDSLDIEAVVTDLEGDPLGRWHVEQDWLAALQEGGMTEMEFSERVIETIESAESA